jgi:uncharacterized protein YndB with AHSA1/START domain
MRGPDGAEYLIYGEFPEVDPPERIVTTEEFGDDDLASLNIDLPHGMVATVLYEDLDGRSRITIRIAHPTADERRKHLDMGILDGWRSGFDRMDRYLAEIK